MHRYFSEFGFVTRALRIPNQDGPKRKFGQLLLLFFLLTPLITLIVIVVIILNKMTKFVCSGFAEDRFQKS